MLNALEKTLSIILYCFTLIASLAMVVVLPALIARILWFSIKCRGRECQKSILILLMLIVGFTAGFAAGLSLHPSNWWTADYSGVDPDAYKNAVEHAKEMIFLFLLFCGHTGAMLALASGKMIQRRLQRRTMNPNNKPVRTEDSGTIRCERSQTAF
jgi:hypothetical protein